MKFDQVVFLGVAQNFRQHVESFPVGSVDLFGLTRVAKCQFFPTSANEFSWIFLLRHQLKNTTLNIDISGKSYEGPTTFHITATDVPPEERITRSVQEEPESFFGNTPVAYTVSNYPQHREVLLVFQLPVGRLFFEPDELQVTLRTTEGAVSLGSISLVFTPPPPLSHDEVIALQSRISGPPIARFSLKPNCCSDSFDVYVAIAPDAKQEAAGFTYYKELGEQFICKCGNVKMPLRYLREGMQSVLRDAGQQTIQAIPAERRLTHSHVWKALEDFRKLIETEQLEGPVQSFLERNQLFFAFLAPRRLFIKPRLQGEFAADFACVDDNGRLTLIELERPSMPLFTAEGKQSAPLTHAYEQIRDWMWQFTTYRSAILALWGVSESEISQVRGLVVAGRTTLGITEFIRRHRGTGGGIPNAELMTLDELALQLEAMDSRLVLEV